MLVTIMLAFHTDTSQTPFCYLLYVITQQHLTTKPLSQRPLQLNTRPSCLHHQQAQQPQVLESP